MFQSITPLFYYTVSYLNIVVIQLEVLMKKGQVRSTERSLEKEVRSWFWRVPSLAVSSMLTQLESHLKLFFPICHPYSCSSVFSIFLEGLLIAYDILYLCKHYTLLFIE